MERYLIAKWAKCYLHIFGISGPLVLSASAYLSDTLKSINM